MPFAHQVVVFPLGVPRSRLERWLIVAAYALAVFAYPPSEASDTQKTLALTSAVVVLVALAAAGALFALSAAGGSHQTCGKVNQADLRAVAAPDYAKKLERLARCGG